jgi:membrane-anchored glycerophosphoryl diester phosphodiesterase (GDPDase)
LIGLWLLTGLIVAALAAGGILVAVLLGVLLGDAGIFLGVLVAIAGVIFAAYFYVKLWLAAPALVLEKQPIVQSLRRSSRLVKGSWWRVFGILVLTAILAVVIGQVLQAPFSLLSYGGSVLDPNAVIEPTFLQVAGGSIGVLLAQAVTLPFQAGVTVLLYIDQRMRKEGLDIELTRATSSASAQPPAP